MKINPNKAIIFLILLIFAWAPWLTYERVVNTLAQDETFIHAHAHDNKINNADDVKRIATVWWMPFGRFALTYEASFVVWFWEAWRK